MVAFLGACALLVITAVLGTAVWVTQRVPTFHIAGCCALVTGGSAGIGFEIARQLVLRQAKVVVIAARRADALQAAAATLRKEAGPHGTRVHGIVMDVSDEASVSRAMVEIDALTAASELNLVVCNAGFAVPARFVDTTSADCRRMMDVNFFGCVNVVREVLPGMLQRRSGRIVLLSSMAARCPIAGYSIYAASKAAIRAFAHSLDMENSCLGVRCQVVSPPDVETPGLREENLHKSPECREISSFGGNVPCGADEMGKCIADGIAQYRFDVSLGIDALLMSWGCSGMEPATGVVHLLLQLLLGGWLRFFMAVYSKLHYGIVQRVRSSEENAPDKKGA